MNTKFEFGPDKGESIVYIRRVMMDSLPEEVRKQAPDVDSLYAVHDAEGARIALVKDRNLAFLLARQNEMTPFSVH